MDFETIVSDIESLGLNLYDFALYTPQGIRAHRFQPCSNCCNSYSVAKAFIMTGLGLLCDAGRLSMSDPIGKHLPIPENADPAWHIATVEHAATHKLGFDEGFLDIDTEDTTLYPAEDYLSMVFDHPLVHAPGSHFQYTDAAYYLLSRLIAAVSGEYADVYLSSRLIRPMRFREIAWSKCPLQHPIGATGLYISAQDMVKLGALYLEDGLWQGKRLLSSDWVQTAIAKEYEFSERASGLIGKGGMYGQMVLFSKEKHFAAAYHAHEENGGCKRLVEYLSTLPAF